VPEPERDGRLVLGEPEQVAAGKHGLRVRRQLVERVEQRTVIDLFALRRPLVRDTEREPRSPAG